MKDIAAEFGVSIVTVSAALRNRGRISPAIRARIIERARELNYTPDLTARGLATGRTGLIGMIVPDLMHPFFAAIAKYMSRDLREKSYSLVISSSEDDPELELEEIEAFLARRVDALVVATSQSSKNSRGFRRLTEGGVPYVLLDRPVNGLAAPFVGSDNEAIGKSVTEYLIDRGYGAIAFIGARGLGMGSGRLRGYKAALKSRGQAVKGELVELVDSADERGEECGYAAMQRLIKRSQRPRAVFCLNDILALGALKAALDAGLVVPRDMAIVGVSNLADLSLWHSFQVPISSVDQNVKEIANRAAEVVIQLLDTQAQPVPKRSLVPFKLVERSSA
jgi:LacI family transcriptional regulator